MTLNLHRAAAHPSPAARRDRAFAAPALALRMALALCGAGVGAGTSAEPSSFVLDPDHTAVHFEVLHFGTSTIRGRFSGLAGEVLLDRSSRRGEVSLRVPTASVSTGFGIFDARLRQADLLASEAHPEAFFVARNFRFEGPPDATRVAEVRGEFTWRGVSQPLSLQAVRFACRQDPPRGDTPAREVCGGDFEAELQRSVFGATFGLPFVGDRVRLLVQVEGTRR